MVDKCSLLELDHCAGQVGVRRYLSSPSTSGTLTISGLVFNPYLIGKVGKVRFILFATPYGWILYKKYIKTYKKHHQNFKIINLYMYMYLQDDS